MNGPGKTTSQPRSIRGSRPRCGSVLAAAAALPLILTACSSATPEAPPVFSGVEASSYSAASPEDNGIWLLRDQPLLEAVLSAVDNAPSVHYSGSFVERIKKMDSKGDEFTADGRKITLAVDRTEAGYTADFTAGKITARIVVVGGNAYVSGNAAFASSAKLPEATSGSVCVTPSDRSVRAWEGLSDPLTLLTGLLLDVDTAASAVQPSKPATEPAAVVLGPADAPVGQLTVSAHGSPLPQRLTVADAGGRAQLSFTDTATAPKVPKDISVACS